jgi:hypothetical protein
MVDLNDFFVYILAWSWSRNVVRGARESRLPLTPLNPSPHVYLDELEGSSQVSAPESNRIKVYHVRLHHESESHKLTTPLFSIHTVPRFIAWLTATSICVLVLMVIDFLLGQVGLCKCLQDVHWVLSDPCFGQLTYSGPEEFFPRCYIIGESSLSDNMREYPNS